MPQGDDNPVAGLQIEFLFQYGFDGNEHFRHVLSLGYDQCVDTA